MAPEQKRRLDRLKIWHRFRLDGFDCGMTREGYVACDDVRAFDAILKSVWHARLAWQSAYQKAWMKWFSGIYDRHVKARGE